MFRTDDHILDGGVVAVVDRKIDVRQCLDERRWSEFAMFEDLHVAQRQGRGRSSHQDSERVFSLCQTHCEGRADLSGSTDEKKLHRISLPQTKYGR